MGLVSARVVQATIMACVVLMASPSLAAPSGSAPRPAPKAAPTTPTAPPPAPAAPVPDPYAEAKRKGDDALVDGRSAEALSFYRDAYAIRPEPALLYNMGRAHQLLGDYPASLDHLERFEAAAPADIRAKVPGLANLIADVRKHIATLAIASNVDGAAVKLDGQPAGTTPLPTVVRTKPGAITVVVEKDGYFPFTKVVSAPGGGIVTVDARLSSRQTTALVTVTSPVVGSAVSLDGKPEGNVPADLVMSAGSHRLALSHPGYQPTEAQLVVAAGERRTLDLALEADKPLTKKWWFWTGIGVVAVGATITVIALTTEKDPGTGTVAPGRISAGLHF